MVWYTQRQIFTLYVLPVDVKVWLMVVGSGVVKFVVVSEKVTFSVVLKVVREVIVKFVVA